MDALIELSTRDGTTPFSTFSLNYQILEDSRRPVPASKLWSLLPSMHHILLGPLKPSNSMLGTAKWCPRVARGYLKLGLAIRDSTLGREQIEVLATTLTQLLNKPVLGVRKVDWCDIKWKVAPVQKYEQVALAMWTIKQWRKFVQRRREESM